MNDTVSGLRSRLKELKDEAERIERALSALEGGRRRGPGRPRGSTSAAAPRAPKAGGGRRRRRKGGTRAEHITKLLRSSDGLSASEIAERLKMKPNYIYRVLAEMQKDGLIRKEGRKVFLAG